MTSIVKSAHFNITLQDVDLAVLCVANESVAKCAWWLIREYGKVKEHQDAIGGFRSILMDDDGLSMVCSPTAIPLLQHFLQVDEYTLSPHYWRAFIIQVTGSAYEVPGAVYCLANSLSIEGLSILHISTFESEVFLIQKPDIHRAIEILRRFEDAEMTAALLDIACKYSSFEIVETSQQELTSPVDQSSQAAVDTGVTDNSVSYDKEENNGEHIDGQLDMSWITPQQRAQSFVDESKFSATKKFEKGFALCVLPKPVYLASLDTSNPAIDWQKCANAIVSLLCYDERFNPVEKIAQSQGNIQQLKSALDELHEKSTRKKEDAERATFMWGSWQHDQEITFLIEECDISLFPPDSLNVSPQMWRVIKLCGRPIAFDETGVVSAMSRVDTNVPSLNISTVITNCTLVPEELLETTATSLSRALNCPVKYI